MIPSGETTSSITYTLKAGCESATVAATTDNPSMITDISVGNGKINFTVTKNQSTSKREGFIYPSVNGTSCDSKKIKVEQAAGEAPTTCDCGNFKINTESLTWESANKEGQNIKITESGNCISNVTPTLKSDSHFTVTINGDTITVTPKDTTTTSKIEETLTISYKANGTECTPAKTVSLTHKASTCTPSECTCYLVSEATCEKVAATATKATVTWSYSAITWNTAADCKVTSSKTEGEESKEVTFAAATCNDYSKTDKFNWTDHRGCNLSTSSCTDTDVEVTWKVEQERPADCDCSCDDLKNIPESISINAGATTSITYTAAECIKGLTIETGDTGITIDTTTPGTIKITGNTKGTSSIKIKYKKGDSESDKCPDKTITVNVNCGTITIDPDKGSCECTGGEVTFNATYTP